MQSDLISLEAASGHGHVLIELVVMMKLAAYRQDEAVKPEAGGILLSFRRAPSFTWSTQPFQEALTGYYGHASGGARIFISGSRANGGCPVAIPWTMSGSGTHPQPYPFPSIIDIGEWKKISTLRGEEQMPFLILSLSPTNAPTFAANMHDELKEMS